MKQQILFHFYSLQGFLTKGFLLFSLVCLPPLRRQFMDSLGLDPESVDNLDMYSHIPPVLMEKCAALSVRPDTVKNLIQSMQGQQQQQLATVTCISFNQV